MVLNNLLQLGNKLHKALDVAMEKLKLFERHEITLLDMAVYVDEEWNVSCKWYQRQQTLQQFKISLAAPLQKNWRGYYPEPFSIYKQLTVL